MLYIHPCLQVRLENNHLFRGKLKRTDLRPSIIEHLKVVADLKNLYVSPITGNCEHLYDQPTSMHILTLAIQVQPLLVQRESANVFQWRQGRH